MPYLTAISYDPTGDGVIDVLADGIVWDLSGTRTLSWALADGPFGDSWDNRALAIQHFTAALESIRQFIDVQFAYVGDFADPMAAGEAGADLVYTLDNTITDDGTLAYAYFPGPGVFSEDQYATEGGDVLMNFSEEIIAMSSFAPGSDGFVTIIHELGHALGLKHPFEETPGRPSIETLNRADIIDVDWMTIMSYSDPLESELERWDPATPMILDVLALQYLYGANSDTFAGDTVHRLLSEDYYYTLWDASGIDVIDLSAMGRGWTVSMPDLPLSTEVPVPVGLAVPSEEYRDTPADMAPTELVWLLGEIEQVIGTDHADVLTGNGLANALSGGQGNDTITGGGGDDTLNGGAGIDTSRHGSVQDRYILTLGPDGVVLQDRSAHGDGTDRLIDIDLLLFDGMPEHQPFDLRKFGGPASLSGDELQTFIELYIAYFNRAPDAVGLSFWGTAYANGLSLAEMAALFVDQPETRAAYAPDLSHDAFARTVYGNVLGRTPDADGLTFWVDALASNALGRDTFILAMLGGAKADPPPQATPEFVAQQQADRDYLTAKTEIGALYAVHRGLSDAANAAAAMALFDGTADGIAAAVSAIDDYHAAALDPETGAFLMPLVGVLDNPFDAVA